MKNYTIITRNFIKKNVSKGYIADYFMPNGQTIGLYFNHLKEFNGFVLDNNIEEDEENYLHDYFFSNDFQDLELEKYSIYYEI